MKISPYSRTAFTLIEVAMVLIIMGIIVGSSTKIFVTMSKNAKLQETKEFLKLVTLDIEGFARTFNRLPTQNEFDSFHMQMKDAWGKPIIYIASKTLFQSICKHKVTDLEHKQDAKSIKNMGFMLISSGPNRNLQTAITDGNAITVKTARVSEEVDFNALKLRRVEAFDDLYVSRSLWSLRGQQKCIQGESL